MLLFCASDINGNVCQPHACNVKLTEMFELGLHQGAEPYDDPVLTLY